LQNQNVSAPLRVDDLPAALRDQFVGETGKFLLQVFPKNDVWQRANQETFVADLRNGGRKRHRHAGAALRIRVIDQKQLRDRLHGIRWRRLPILVFFHFRTLGSVILALLPVGIGTLWLAGLMGRFGIPFNLANIMTLPLVIGIGVTNGIHILNRFAEERTPGILARSTGKAVLVSGIDGHRRFRQSDSRQTSGHSQFGLRDGRGNNNVHDCGFDFSASLVESAGPMAPSNKTTQCRQNIADTGSGGTEVKTSIIRKRFNENPDLKSTRMLISMLN
jgi:hypothetical protein